MLHYMCCPLELEQLSPKEFFEQYEVLDAGPYSGGNVMPFVDTQWFQNPSNVTVNGVQKNLQVVRQHKTPKLAKV